MTKKAEKIIASIIALLIVIFSINRYYEDRSLKNEGFFTVGRLTSASFAGGQGWIYDFTYKVNEKFYNISYNGRVKDCLSTDSLVFLRISNSDYSLWRLITDKKVPECIEFSKVPEMGWEDIEEICKP
jgi:hypothetical protein